MRKLLTIAFGSIILIAAAVSLLLHAYPLCGEEVTLEKTSPNGRYVAVLMRRDCGATTPFVSHINLRVTGSQFHQSFFSGTIVEGEVWASSKYSGSRFCWLGPRQLEIGYPNSKGIPTASRWHDVVVGSDFRNPTCQ